MPRSSTKLVVGAQQQQYLWDIDEPDDLTKWIGKELGNAIVQTSSSRSKEKGAYVGDCRVDIRSRQLSG